MRNLVSSIVGFCGCLGLLEAAHNLASFCTLYIFALDCFINLLNYWRSLKVAIFHPKLFKQNLSICLKSSLVGVIMYSKGSIQ